MITPARCSHDHAGDQAAVEWLDNQVRLLRRSIPGDNRFNAPAQVVARRNARDRFSWLQSNIGYLEHGAYDRRNFLWPSKLDGAIGLVLALEIFGAVPPLFCHLDPGSFINCERYGLILAVGQGRKKI